MLSESITYKHITDMTKVSGCMAVQIDLLPINSKMITEHLETLDKYRKCSELSSQIKRDHARGKSKTSWFKLQFGSWMHRLTD